MPPASLHTRLTPPDLAAQPLLPLAGLTVLAVEDSRFASDALRLLCQRSGARLRRAANLHAARAHLSVYRPDAVIVDLGLPDGRGEGLIRDLVLHGPSRPRILGCSGDPDGRGMALAAGADGFLDKPLPGLAAFQCAVLGLPPLPQGLVQADVLPPPDPLALQDDLAEARRLTRHLITRASGDGGTAAQGLSVWPTRELALHSRNLSAAHLSSTLQKPSHAYLAAFVTSLARSSNDTVLEQAAKAARHSHSGLQRLDHLLAQRLGETRAFSQDEKP
ncbi:response regulator [Fertoebacter nigrum]|uniref:Response regulator n=1 Tax=Fertoeibacter niger TaxID=2656921 RepID=A0A8X8H2G1_9RHOB|nr:response regulator [Fertoeibacter niger]NUB44333.1 response regulator [Fertoeibacter niger]